MAAMKQIHRIAADKPSQASCFTFHYDSQLPDSGADKINQMHGKVNKALNLYRKGYFVPF